MASIYHIDFPIIIFESFTIEAEDDNEAHAIANSLWKSTSFYYDFIYDDVEGGGPGDVGKPIVMKSERNYIASLTKETVSRYMKED